MNPLRQRDAWWIILIDVILKGGMAVKKFPEGFPKVFRIGHSQVQGRIYSKEYDKGEPTDPEGCPTSLFRICDPFRVWGHLSMLDL
jgi:hypothetical protein